LAVALFFVTGISAAGAQSRPNLVPNGWKAAPKDANFPGQKYVSPDGSAWLTTYAAPARSASRDGRIHALGYADGERVTYERRTGRFLAISGYRGDRIFYRKSNLACGGTRWHSVELEYPAAAKRRMDGIVTSIAHNMNHYDEDCRNVRRSAER